MKIYVGIDGTDNEDRLEASIATSFVKRIGSMGFDRTLYIPGTKQSLLGWDSDNKSREAMRWIRFWNNTTLPGRAKCKVYLGGFSRGAVSAIYASHLLNDIGIHVTALFLFDAVDRTWSIANKYSEKIPENVGMAYHVYRDVDSGSRRSFGKMHDALRGEGVPNLKVKKVLTTHGAVGGWRNGSEFLVDSTDYEETYAGSSELSTPSVIFQRSTFKERRELTGASNITAKQQIIGQKESIRWMTQRVSDELKSAEG